MKIIESSIIGKKSQEACEDGMVVTDDFIAVIDGSTSKTPKHLNPDMKNGRYAMMLISDNSCWSGIDNTRLWCGAAVSACTCQGPQPSCTPRRIAEDSKGEILYP